MDRAKNRHGEVFSENEEVKIWSTYHPKVTDRIFIIKDITAFEACESGHMIQVIDKETGNPLKSKLDTNWFLKLNKK